MTGRPAIPAFEGRTMRIRPSLPQAGPTIWEVVRTLQSDPRTIAERYAEWRETEAGRTVYRESVRRAFQLRSGGVHHYGMKAIAESIRFDRAVRVGSDDEGFKLNNTFVALLSREIMAAYDELAEFFETRVRKSL